MEFKPFPKIEQINKASMHITQKIHGTNAQVFIYEDETGALQLKCGSRTRWITPESDNYGFATFVYANKQEFIEKLGKGQHFGEWAGLGINSGEGLSSRVFVLFDFWKFPPARSLPLGCCVVPVLYQGSVDLNKVDLVMQELKSTGSKLSPGFMRPEGVVVMAFGTRYKKVFEAEDTRWKAGDENAKRQKDEEALAIQLKYGHLFQPIRLEKLLSREENYLTNFPKSMPSVVEDYFKDLIEEGQLDGLAGSEKDIRRAINSQLFKFVREKVESML